MFTDYEVVLGCSDNTNCVKAEPYYSYNLVPNELPF